MYVHVYDIFNGIFATQAVLESKWPSSDTNAYLLWTKVRNAIMAVAQFRKALRRRRLSVYSTSESDFDRISRTSTDSLADDIQPLDKVDAVKTEFVNDLVSVESPNMEERTSTGERRRLMYRERVNHVMTKY